MLKCVRINTKRFLLRQKNVNVFVRTQKQTKTDENA